jgi:hypothetical protein
MEGIPALVFVCDAKNQCMQRFKRHALSKIINTNVVKFLEQEIHSEAPFLSFPSGMRGEKTSRSLGSMWAGLAKGVIFVEKVWAKVGPVADDA